MTSTDHETLAARIESGTDMDSATADATISALRGLLPEGAQVGIGKFESSDAVVRLIDEALPTWSITAEGIANDRNGHWHCYLRRSRGRDNDEMIGIGKGPQLRLALLAALLRVLAYRAQHGE